MQIDNIRKMIIRMVARHHGAPENEISDNTQLGRNWNAIGIEVNRSLAPCRVYPDTTVRELVELCSSAGR